MSKFGFEKLNIWQKTLDYVDTANHLAARIQSMRNILTNKTGEPEIHYLIDEN